MPPIWHDAGGYKLYVYARETHRRPHMAVVIGRTSQATIDIETGEILAGTVPQATLRKIRRVLAEHRAEAIAAFEAGINHERVVRLDLGHSERKDRGDE